MKLRAISCILVILAAVASQADEQVRRVQEELRKRNLYFGDVDGRKTAEIQGAIRRYQTRKGFQATGDLSSDTLRSLGIASTGKEDDEWPEGIVLKSDAARELSEAEKNALEEGDGGDLPPIAEAPSSSGSSAKIQEPEAAPPAADVSSQMRTFVEQYLAACETNRLDEEMGFYADRMSYFDHGTVDRAFVARDVQRFYQRWPQRHYDLLDCKLTKAAGDERDVTFRIAFHYKNPDHTVAGHSVNYFKAREDSSGIHFTALREQRIRD